MVLKPGQNKTLFRVGYVNPNNSKMDIISYLEFKTNASDFTIPLMVYDGQLSQVCKTLCSKQGYYIINVLVL